ncbi:MAG: hypothetical protein C0618_08220 [Desulfuromonas sp.]|nr:MAG: hypothetical protein C0618_08220 [Desulfuromonas sp.]
MLKLATHCLCLVLLTACSLHTPHELIAPEPPDQYIEQSSSATSASPDSWWLSFNDPHLNRLMDELFAGNLELKQAFARLEQSRALLSASNSSRYPTLNLEGQKGRSQQPQLVGDATTDSWQVAASAAFEIDLWNRLASQHDAAAQDVSASIEDTKTLYLSLSAQLASLYYQVIGQRAQLALADQTIESFKETLSLVENRYKKGLVGSIDVYQARQSLSQVRANRHASESALAISEHAIAVLLGRYPDRQSAGDLHILPPVPDMFPTGLPADLLAQRPDLQAQLHRVAAADARIATAIAERFPRINLIGSYGRSHQEVTSGLIEGNFWNFLGQLTVPLLDAGRRKAEVTRSRAALDQAVSRYRQQVLIAFREVEDALTRNRTTELRITQLAATKRMTEATLRLARQRYRSGLTDYLPVLVAQRSNFDTHSQLLSARQQLLTERITLARALGGQWMNDHITQRLITKKADSHE